MSISLKEGDACPYCGKGAMVSVGGSAHVLRCDRCGTHWYYSHEDQPKTQ